MDKTYMGMFEQGLDFQKKMMENFSDAINMSGKFAETQQSYMNAMESYGKLFDFWNRCAWKPGEGAGDGAASENCKKFIDEMSRMSFGFFNTKQIDELNEMLTRSADLGKAFMDSTESFMAPWSDRKEEIGECIQGMLRGDVESGKKYMDLITQAYSESAGKVLNSNNIGLTKDQMSENMMLCDAYFRMMLSYIRMLAGIQGVMKEAGEEMWQRSSKKISSEGSIDFRDFYDMWLEIYSKAINDFYFTDEFGEFLRELADNSSDFKKKSDKFMERMLSPLPVPVDSDMKSLYKTVYDLRKEVRELRKEIEALKEAAAAAKGVDSSENGGK